MIVSCGCTSLQGHILDDETRRLEKLLLCDGSSESEIEEVDYYVSTLL